MKQQRFKKTGIEQILSGLEIFMKRLRKKFFPELTTRPMIQFIATQNKKEDLVGIEIGVREGHNAKNILTKLPVKKIYLIDPYEKYSQNEKDLDFSICFDKAKKRLSKFKRKTEFITKKSEEAVADITNDIDFIYIDGNHQYKNVKQDMELYYDKLKDGGIMGGHDINNHDVLKAFSEFVKDKKKFYVHNCDWWVIKRIKK
jgi:hypothetical protein